MNEFHGVAINPDGWMYLSEHLAPICTIMDIPLTLPSKKTAQQVAKYYPDLKTQVIESENFSLSYLFEKYDVIFHSDTFDLQSHAKALKDMIQNLDKDAHIVHCPHGFSDKGFWFERSVNEDITLIYGQNELDLLRERGVLQNLKHYVMVGNTRLPYYQKHQKHFDEIVQKEVFAQFDQERPTLLYAPTWQDPENSSSFVDASEILLKQLPKEFNIIIKLHPRTRNSHKEHLNDMIEQYKAHPQVVILEDYPLVYPILSKSVAYIGDMSSIGYDFLAFDRPLFLLNQNRRDTNNDRGLFLYRCGVEITPDQYKNIFSLIKETLVNDQKSESRQQVYRYTFGKERGTGQIRKDLILQCENHKLFY
ncbi:MAG: hypothetical protein CMO81_05100 [Waddliaceae bacterium]|nr:hypothetical protein [Waddliaceae bacterium]